MILDQFGREYVLEKKPDREVLAVAPIYDSQRDYVADGLTPRRLAAIFREADTGDVRRQAELFDALEDRDSHIIGEMGKRENAINDIEFALTPASEDSRDVKVAEFVEKVLGEITDFDDIMVGLQQAVGKGYASFELHWDVSSGQAVPRDLEWLEQRRFRFVDPVTGYVRKTPLLISDANPMGDEIPAWKTIFHRYKGKSGNATRAGVFRVCTWMFLFKNYSIKDWVIFCERYGMPLRLGYYAAGASTEDKRALRIALATIGTDAAGIISESTKIEFIESMKGATASGLWEKLASFCNREQSKAILGMAQSSDSKSPGSFASDKVKDMVRQDLLKADTFAAARTVRHQLIRPLVGFNFGWDTPVPGYGPDWEEQEDLKTKAEYLDKLIKDGVPVPVNWAKREFGIPDPEEGEALVTNTEKGKIYEYHLKAGVLTKNEIRESLGLKPIAGGEELVVLNDFPAAESPAVARLNPGKGNGSFLAGKAQPGANKTGTRADTLASRLDDEAGPIMDGMIEAVRELVMTAGSLDEIRDGLIDLCRDMDPKDLGSIIAQALSVAELAGRYDIEGE